MSHRVVRKIVDQLVDLRGGDMAEALEDEYNRRCYRYSNQSLKPISQNVGDVVELTGEDQDNFSFPTVPGQLGKVTGILNNGFIGVMMIIDNDGDFCEQKFTYNQVRTIHSNKSWLNS